MSAPRQDWAEIAARVAPIILGQFSNVEAAIPSLREACGNQALTANALRAAMRARGKSGSLSQYLKLPTASSVQVVQAEQQVPPTADPLERHKERTGASKLRQERDALIERLKQAEDRQVVLNALGKPVRIPTIRPREVVSGFREATAVALASDWHIEETVFPEQVGFRNEYNLQTSEARAARFFEGILWLVRSHRSSFTIRDLLLWLGGDLITGYIHEELEETNELSPMEALLYLRDILVSGIDLLLKEGDFERIIVPCSHGNHGRVHSRKRIKTGAQNSFEWLLYNFLSLHYENDRRVEFIVDKSAHQYAQVYGWTMHFHHGDDVKFGGGVGGISIPINKRIPKWDSVRPSHYHCIGHFHTYTDLGRITTNGSLIGYTEYAMSFGADYEEPKQAFFLVDSKRGKTMCSPIWVDEHAPRLEAA